MKFLISGHGEYPQGVYNTLKFFKDDLSNVDFLSVDDAQFEEKMIGAVKDNYDHDLIIITDLLGGSANLYAAQLLRQYDFHLVSGVNVSFLLEMIFSESKTAAEIMDVIAMAKDQMVFVNDVMENMYAQTT